MYPIPLNETGTHVLEVTANHLETIQKYALFQDLIDSSGIINESVLEKLRLNIQSILRHEEKDKLDLLTLSSEVIYHKKMKAYGLHQLVLLYLWWQKDNQAKETGTTMDE